MMEEDLNIDIHLHTSNSDGDFSTREIVEKAKELNIDILSITDHETIKSYEDLKNIDTKGIKIVAGVEIASCYKSEPRDILGYDYDMDKMQNVLKKIDDKKKYIEEQKIFLEDYKKVFRSHGIILSEPIGEINGSEKHEAYVRILEASFEHKDYNLDKYPGLSNPSKFFWDNCANKDSSWYVDETRFSRTIKDVIDLIHEAEGLAFFAHPCIHGRNYEEVREMLDEAREAGIDGVEVKHARHSKEDILFLKNYADEYGLYKSGGSDFHGSPKPEISMLSGQGDLKVNYKMIKPWFEKVNLISK